MNWDAIGAISTLIGSVAVIATLIYLARQVQEANRLGSSTMVSEVTKSFAEFNDMIISNAQVAELFAKLKANECQLSDGEAVQVRHLVFRYMDIYVQAQDAYDRDYLSRDLFKGMKDTLKWTLATYPGLEADFRDALKSMPAFDLEVFDYFQRTG